MDMRLKELFSARDMTQGAPWQRILEFSIPMLLGNIAQQLYNTADSVIVGLYVGDNALAAVGSSSPILNLLLVLFMGISVGAGVMVSQFFGAKNRRELSITIGNAKIMYGSFIQNIIDFLIIATSIFIFIKLINVLMPKKEESKKETKKEVSEEVLLLREIRDNLNK